MVSIYSKDYFVSAADAGPEGRLSLIALTQRIIEIATEHANSLGIGNPDMKATNGGWVLARLTIEAPNAPKVNTGFRLLTWIEDWNRMFSTRCFAVETPDGEVLGYARTVWMVINLQTHENIGLSHLHLPDIERRPRECPVQPQKRHRFPEEAPAGTYTFRYTDLDYYRHVNTLKWIELLLNQYSLQTLDSHDIARFEIAFTAEGHYGQTINIFHRRLEEQSDKQSAQPAEFTDEWILGCTDGRPLVSSRLILSPAIPSSTRQ